MTHFFSFSDVLGLVIDITPRISEYRYYEPREFKDWDVQYVPIQGLIEDEVIPERFVPPSRKQVEKFYQSVTKFFKENPNPNALVAVISTTGNNRAGYLIVSYMVEIQGKKLDDALIAFAKSKHSNGGIYSKDCLDLLEAQTKQKISQYKPVTPSWDKEYDKIPKTSKQREAEPSTYEISKTESSSSNIPSKSSVAPAAPSSESNGEAGKSEIPKGWVKIWSERNQRYYFFNEKTKESKWEIPKS